MSKIIKLDSKNFNKHTPEGMELLEKSISEVGAIESVTVDAEGEIITGNARKETFDKLGYKPKFIELAENEYPVIQTDLTGEKRVKAAIYANTVAQKNINLDLDLIQEVAIEEYEWDIDELNEWGVEVSNEWEQAEEHNNDNKPTKLCDRFIIPPFSVFDTRQAYWQDRKREWLSLGIKSEIGREENSLGLSNAKDYQYQYNENYITSKGTSIFDPVLTEICYKWFNVDKGKILDPFAGGSVRGIVASVLGYEYLGNDLREEQIIANRENAKEVLKDAELYPVWTTGDSMDIDKIAKDYKADMIFSCPPYADLEVYSDDERDISNMEYNEFLEVYRDIIRKSVDLLKDNRFAVFVVSEVRDKKGNYYNFVGDTIKAFTDCGLHYYNEIILYNAIGNLAMRAGKYMNTRKVGRTHQNVLVFYKGDMKAIKDNYPKIDIVDIGELHIHD